MTSVVKYEISCGHPAHISAIDFDLLTSQQIKDYSVLECTSTTMYSRSVPGRNSINDTRMGTCDRHVRCTTCGNNVNVCPGHCGHIDLRSAFFHTAYLDSILKIARCLCVYCGRPKVELEDKYDSDWTRKQIFAYQYNLCKNRRKCTYCQRLQITYTRSGVSLKCTVPQEILDEHPNEADELRKSATPVAMLDLFRCISDSDWRLLGFDPTRLRPEALILQAALVPPPICRPSITNDQKSRGQDDLSHKLQDILKRSQTFLERDANDSSLSLSYLDEEIVDKFQADLGTLYNNNSRGVKSSVQRSGAPLKTIKARIAGKEGRVRGNLLGKRTDASARSVISPDPTLDVDEVGVPISIACTLTFPERVTTRNIESLQARVLKGANVIDGAATCIHTNGDVIDLEHCQNLASIKLVNGTIVERYMQDGDWVVFNRQPSLHAASMMGHRVKVYDIGDTFRLNPLCCKPYNADFDGDEMNLHMPQSEAAVAEVKHLMSVSEQMITSQSNRACFGLVQDTLLGAYLMCSDDVFLEYSHASQAASLSKRTWSRWKATNRRNSDVSGKTMLELALPNNLNFTCSTLSIENGRITKGRMCKSNVGSSSNSMIEIVARDLGKKTALHVMSDLQNMIDYYLQNVRGFSCGISDCVLTNEQNATSLQKMMNKSFEHVEAISTKIADTSISVTPEEKEGAIINILSNVLASAGTIVSNNLEQSGNRIEQMVVSGSKGSSINTAQILGCVGQNCVEGRRITPHPSATRSLPCLPEHDTSIKARGFVKSSFHQGLDPIEYFCHTQAGREGLVDTAVKTAGTGYLQRKLIKFMESAMTAYRGPKQPAPIVNAAGQVIQFDYGSDSCCPTYLEKVDMSWILLSDDDIRASCEEHEWRPICQLRDSLRQVRVWHVAIEKIDTDFHLPVNVSRRLRCFHNEDKLTDAIFDRVDKQTYSRALAEVLAAIDAQFCALSSVALRAHVLWELRWQQAQNNTTTTILRVAALIKQIALTCCATPGTMVGPIAAQSVGEPLTQMTLNTFHYAGVGSKNVTLGVPRVQELIGVSKSIRHPCSTFSVSPYLQSEEAVTAFSKMIEYLTLGDICNHSFLQSCNEGLHPDDVQFYAQVYQYDCDRPLCIMLHLNREKMMSYSLRPCHVRKALTEYCGSAMNVMCSSDVRSEWKVIVMTSANCDANVETYHRLNSTLMSIHVSGVKGVKRAVVRSVQSPQLQSPGGKIATEPKFVIDIYGSAYRRLFTVDGLLWSTSVTNDVYAVYQELGIEAATTALFHELKLCFGFDGTYVNARHIALIADHQTQSGDVVPMSRHGINKSACEPLNRCSFEETFDVILDAALFSQTDNMKGITASIMTGQKSQMGTGASDFRWAHSQPMSDTEQTQRHLMARAAPRHGGVLRCKPRGSDVSKPTFTTLQSKYNISRNNHSNDSNPFATACGFVPFVLANEPSAFEECSFTPLSPQYVDDAVTEECQSPTYCPSSPTYCPLSPTYCPQSPEQMSSCDTHVIPPFTLSQITKSAVDVEFDPLSDDELSE